MKVAEYRDLVSGLSDLLASVRSAATYDELSREVSRLQQWMLKVETAQCSTAKPKDTNKANRLLKLCRECVSASLMAIHDSERIGNDYYGIETPFVNPSEFDKLKHLS